MPKALGVGLAFEQQLDAINRLRVHIYRLPLATAGIGRQAATGTAVLQDAVQVRAIPGVFAKLRRERQLEAVVMVAVEYFGDRLQQRGVDQRGVVGAS